MTGNVMGKSTLARDRNFVEIITSIRFRNGPDSFRTLRSRCREHAGSLAPGLRAGVPRRERPVLPAHNGLVGGSSPSGPNNDFNGFPRSVLGFSSLRHANDSSRLTSPMPAFVLAGIDFANAAVFNTGSRMFAGLRCLRTSARTHSIAADPVRLVAGDIADVFVRNRSAGRPSVGETGSRGQGHGQGARHKRIESVRITGRDLIAAAGRRYAEGGGGDREAECVIGRV